MDLYKIIIAPEAMEQLNEYVSYIKYELLNESAARGVYDDATETGSELTKVAGSLQYCRSPLLRKYGYRVILFRHHQYLMVYRIEGKIAYVDGIFHQKQDYENLFARMHGLK